MRSPQIWQQTGRFIQSYLPSPGTSGSGGVRQWGPSPRRCKHSLQRPCRLCTLWHSPGRTCRKEEWLFWALEVKSYIFSNNRSAFAFLLVLTRQWLKKHKTQYDAGASGGFWIHTWLRQRFNVKQNPRVFGCCAAFNLMVGNGRRCMEHQRLVFAGRGQHHAG